MCVLVGDLLSENHVRAADGCRPRYSLDAVDEYFATLLSGLDHEIYCFVEDAGDVLANVVLQMKTEVFDALICEVVLAIVSSAIDYVCNSNFFESFLIFGD